MNNAQRLVSPVITTFSPPRFRRCAVARCKVALEEKKPDVWLRLLKEVEGITKIVELILLQRLVKVFWLLRNPHSWRMSCFDTKILKNEFF